MKTVFALLILVAPLIVVGCTSPSATSPNNTSADEEKIKANLAKLSPEDRKLAEEQKFCAVESENRLGSMGVPKPVKLKGETVFVCCGHCIKEAEANADKTLDKVKELRAANSNK